MSQNGLKAPEGDQEKFIYRVSHDLQEPARGTKAYLTLLEKKLGEDLPPEARQFMNLATAQVDTLQKMIKGLVELSRVSRNTEEAQDFDFRLLLEQVQKLYSYSIPLENWTLELSGGTHIHARFGQLRQAIQYIVENAVHHSPDARFVVSSEREENWIKWTFLHENAQLPAGSEEQIFELFHSSKKKEGHAGLGLALAKAIVENNGGKVAADRVDDSQWALYLHLPISLS